MVINRKERFATEGVRFQRHNGDGTIPTPKRFIGFANTVDLSKVVVGGSADLSIKVDYNPTETKPVSFGSVVDISRVTTAEAVAALTAAGFSHTTWGIDPLNQRIKGTYSSGVEATLTLELTNTDTVPYTLLAGAYTYTVGAFTFRGVVASDVVIAASGTSTIILTATKSGVVSGMPTTGPATMNSLTPILPMTITGAFTAVTVGVDPLGPEQVIQIFGPLAAALDFGQSLKFGGNGLEMFSFFDDETISIGLPKDIKDKEEIDIEGAKGTITRMVIGSMLQGLSPVVTLKTKDYYLLEAVQGGRLDRVNGTYDPPLSNESDHPSFYAEIYSAVYSAGSNKLSDVAGYEKLLLRSMIGSEGDVPIEAKAWAQYAFNMTATEYVDKSEGLDIHYPAYQEQSLTLEQYDALKLKQVAA